MPVQLGDDDTSNVDLDKFTSMMWSGDHDTGDDGGDNTGNQFSDDDNANVHLNKLSTLSLKARAWASQACPMLASRTNTMFCGSTELLTWSSTVLNQYCAVHNIQDT